MNIFVICAYHERKQKYDDRYTIYPALWWEDIPQDMVDLFHFRYNAKDELKKKITACSMSHLNLLSKIVEEKLEKVIILEDDAIVDFDRLDELEKCKGFTYIGGDVRPPLLKNDNHFDKTKIKHVNGLNTINTDDFVILGGFGYFIYHWKDAQDILNRLPYYDKYRAIDVMYKHLQKEKVITDYIYPPLVKLYMPDALSGYSAKQMKLKDDFSKY